MEQFKDVDWVEALERLTLEALRWFNSGRFATDERVLESFGDGFEDLAQEAILELLDERNPKVTWSASRGPATTNGVVAYLRAVIRNDFHDRVRRKRLKGQRSIERPAEGEDGVQFVVEPPDSGTSADDVLIRRETLEPVRKRLDDDFKLRPDENLQLYLMLQFDGDRYAPYTPAEAARELGMDVKEIYLLKEKLERRLHRLFKAELEAVRAESARKAL